MCIKINSRTYLSNTCFAHQKKESKVKEIIVDSLKDNLNSHIDNKNTGNKMFNSLVKLLQNSCPSQNMLL